MGYYAGGDGASGSWAPTSGGGGGGAWQDFLNDPNKTGRAASDFDAERRAPRMNPLNPRALRRSMRRVQRFAKFAQHTIAFTKRVKMKKHRRK